MFDILLFNATQNFLLSKSFYHTKRSFSSIFLIKKRRKTKRTAHMNCSLITLLSRKNSDILVTTFSQTQCLCWFAELFFHSISTTDTIYSFFALSQTLYFVYKFFLFQLFFQEINFFSDILETCRHSLSTTSCHSPTEIIPSMGCSFLSFG
jgi:hypothetical protein